MALKSWILIAASALAVSTAVPEVRSQDLYVVITGKKSDAAPPPAAIALVTSGQAQTNGTTTVSGLNTTGATLLLVCNAADGGTDGASVVTDSKSNTWTRINQIANGSGSHASLWYSTPTSVGASHDFSFNGAFGSATMVQAFSGTATVSVLDGSATSNSGSFLGNLQPGSRTPAANGSLLATCLSMQAGTAAETINSGFTISSDMSDAGGTRYPGAFAYLIQSTAAPVNPTWSGTDWAGARSAAINMQAFKPQ